MRFLSHDKRQLRQDKKQNLFKPLIWFHYFPMTFRDNCVPLPQMENQRRKKETDQVRCRKNKPWQWLSAKTVRERNKKHSNCEGTLPNFEKMETKTSVRTDVRHMLPNPTNGNASIDLCSLAVGWHATA